MLKKASCTVRVVNIDPSLNEDALRSIFEESAPKSILDLSLASFRHGHLQTQMATITFKNESDAIRATALNDTQAGESKLGVDRDFLGLTVLYCPDSPEVELVCSCS